MVSLGDMKMRRFILAFPMAMACNSAARAERTEKLNQMFTSSSPINWVAAFALATVVASGPALARDAPSQPGVSWEVSGGSTQDAQTSHPRTVRHGKKKKNDSTLLILLGAGAAGGLAAGLGGSSGHSRPASGQ